MAAGISVWAPSCLLPSGEDPGSQSTGLLESVGRVADALTTPTGVYTQHNDNLRSGTYLNESVLTPSTVVPAQQNGTHAFGLLHAVSSNGSIYGQPLYVPNVNIFSGGYRNVLYAATESGTVESWDADTMVPLWALGLTTSPGSPVPTSDYPEYIPNTDGYSVFWGEISITSTPVIANGTMYVVAVSKNGTDPISGAPLHVQQLHAIDIAQGAEVPGSPVTITANVSGVAFDPLILNQRAALLLSPQNPGQKSRNVLDIAWSSHGDVGRDNPSQSTYTTQLAYNGWVLAYDPTTLAQLGAWCNGCGLSRPAGGIWQAGAGLAAGPDSGDVYLMTGNGTYDGVQGFADSVVRLGLRPNGSQRHRLVHAERSAGDGQLRLGPRFVWPRAPARPAGFDPPPDDRRRQDREALPHEPRQPRSQQ